jgi:hypothetical protein
MSNLQYWIDNFIFLAAFILYEVMLIPFVYLKVGYNIVQGSGSIWRTIMFTVYWIFLGPAFTFVFIS